MPHLIWRFKETESLRTIGKEIGNDGDWTEFLVQDFCKIMSIIVPSFAEQSRQKSAGQEPELDKRRAYDCHSFVENILQKDVCEIPMLCRNICLMPKENDLALCISDLFLLFRLQTN